MFLINVEKKSNPYAGLDKPFWLQEGEAPRMSWQLAHEGGKVVSCTHRPLHVLFPFSSPKRPDQPWGRPSLLFFPGSKAAGVWRHLRRNAEVRCELSVPTKPLGVPGDNSDCFSFLCPLWAWTKSLSVHTWSLRLLGNFITLSIMHWGCVALRSAVMKLGL